jgi:hypothetical protein
VKDGRVRSAGNRSSRSCAYTPTPTGGDVNLDVQMRWPPNYDQGWDGTLVVAAEAAEKFADRMCDFLGC